MDEAQKQAMAEAVAKIRENMTAAAKAAGRDPSEVLLCAACKTRTVEEVRYSADLVVLHGDDQGAIADLLPILNDGTYKNYDCCLGSRFMKGSRIKGYSALRVVGNYGFNWLFSLVAGRAITDLGSGLNLYAVEPLKTEYYKKFPDTLYFNDCMILALCQLKQRVLFFPISWREEDQVSNNKLTSFGISLLKLCGRYLAGKQKFVTREWREKPIENYTSSVIASNL